MDKNQRDSSVNETNDTALCAFCEMIVFWVQVQLRQQKAKNRVFNYVNKVKFKNSFCVLCIGTMNMCSHSDWYLILSCGKAL